MASVAIRCSVSSTGEENSGENLDPRIYVGVFWETSVAKIHDKFSWLNCFLSKL